MSNAKRYAFWIAVGSLAFVELVVFILALSDVNVIGSLEDARKTKKDLDKEYSHLRELDERSKRVLSGRFDAERPGDIQQLIDQYLITPAWKPVLERQVDEYHRTYASICRYLAQRSLPLAAPIAETDDKLEWYTAYQRASVALLKTLHAEVRLDLAAAGRSEESTTEPDFAEDARLRELAGLFTKASDYPEVGERPRITARFRATEQVVAALRRAVPQIAANPVVGGAPESLPPARITAWAWESAVASAVAVNDGAKDASASRGDVPLTGPLADLATAWRLSLTLTGPLPSVMAAEAALEHGDPDGPLLVVTGLELRRKESFRLGERKDAASEDVRAQMSVLVLDFAPAAAAASSTAPAVKAKPAAKPTAKPGKK